MIKSSSSTSAQSGKQKLSVPRKVGLNKSAKTHKKVNGKVERIKRDHQVWIDNINGRKLPEKYQSDCVRTLEMKQNIQIAKERVNCVYTREAFTNVHDEMMP